MRVINKLSRKFSCSYSHAFNANKQIHSEFPGVFHHNSEVFVAVNRATDTFVIFAELVKCDNTILFLCVPLHHELLEYFIGRLPPCDDFGVLRSVVDLSNIIKFDKTVLVDV